MKRMNMEPTAFGREDRDALDDASGRNHPDTPCPRHPFLESEAALDDFVHRWQAGRLTKAEWTHAAHVGTAAYFAFDLEPEALFERMKTGITYHNECVGTANTQDSGYHETLTRFWTGTISEFVRKGRFSTRFEAVKSATKLFGEDRNRHRSYYSFDVAKDRRARREWISPDRKPPMVEEPV